MEHPSRKDIRDALAALDKSLCQYEQTTHGTLWAGGIEHVAKALVKAYHRPGAFEVSELSQCIRKFLKQETKE